MPYGLRRADEATLEVFEGKLRVKDQGLDSRKTAECKTYTNPSTGFTIEHENKAVVHVIFSDEISIVETDATTAIADGSVVGQKLKIVVTSTSGVTIAILTIKDNANTKFLGDWYRSFGGESVIPAWLELVWDGTDWQQNNTNDGSPADMSGMDAHAEGYGTIADGLYSHAEGNTTDAGGVNTHAEGSVTDSSGDSAHAEGRATVASGVHTHAEGYLSEANGGQSHAQGYRSKSSLQGQHASASGAFAAAGDCQFSRFILRGNTSNATQTELTSPERFDIASEFTMACRVTVCGRQNDGTDNFMGVYHVLIRNNAGTTALVGAVSILYENNAGGWGAGGGLPVEILADDTNDALAVHVEGLAGHNIRWAAMIEPLEVGY